MEKWYAIMAKPRQECTSISALEHAGIPTYFPMVKESYFARGRRQFRLAGLFPGYFFASFEYGREYRLVAYCRGVKKIVTFGNVPAEVEPHFLDEIKAGLELKEINHVPGFKPGDAVQIRNGPLAGVRAVFESSLSGKDRIVILLRELSFQTRAAVRLSDIERYSEAV